MDAQIRRRVARVSGGSRSGQGARRVLPNDVAMVGREANHRWGSIHDSVSAVGRRALAGLVAIVKTVSTFGTLSIRLIAAGTLLVGGLPALTILLYLWGYPTAPAPPPVVILVDGLQLLILAFAVVVVAQLVVYGDGVLKRFGRRIAHRPSASWCQRPLRGEAVGGGVRACSDQPAVGWKGLREWSLRLADLIWVQELRGRPEFGPAALSCVREGVTLELEHRRRIKALERRAAELEAWIAHESVVASERM